LNIVPQPSALKVDNFAVELFALFSQNEVIGTTIQFFVAEPGRVFGVNLLEAGL
jgi:hypothetical protein